MARFMAIIDLTETSEWNNGNGIDVTSSSVLAWAFSNVAVDDPSDPESTFNEHTDCELSRSHFLRRILTK